MSQADMDVANGSGATLLADMNEAGRQDESQEEALWHRRSEWTLKQIGEVREMLRNGVAYEDRVAELLREYEGLAPCELVRHVNQLSDWVVKLKAPSPGEDLWFSVSPPDGDRPRVVRVGGVMVGWVQGGRGAWTTIMQRF